MQQKFSLSDGASSYSANFMGSKLSELSLLMRPINEQLFSSTFLVEDVMSSKLDFYVPKMTGEIIFAENSKEL